MKFQIFSHKRYIIFNTESIYLIYARKISLYHYIIDNHYIIRISLYQIKIIKYVKYKKNQITFLTLLSDCFSGSSRRD